MRTLKAVGWIALLAAAMFFTYWRISTCNCWPPQTGAHWLSLSVKLASGLLISGYAFKNAVGTLESLRVPR
jgi:hypothetical protein